MKIRNTIMTMLMVCSIQYGMRFLVSVTVLILTLSFASCDTNKGSNNKTLLVLLGLGRGHPTTATRVYGQGGSFTTNTVNNGGISATSLNGPPGVALDSSGNLYVADFWNNRVLYYSSGNTTATRVYGQGGDFTTNTANNGGISATSLYNPYGVVVDGSGNLYVVDNGNNRVLYY